MTTNINTATVITGLMQQSRINNIANMTNPHPAFVIVF